MISLVTSVAGVLLVYVRGITTKQTNFPVSFKTHVNKVIQWFRYCQNFRHHQKSNLLIFSSEFSLRPSQKWFLTLLLFDELTSLGCRLNVPLKSWRSQCLMHTDNEKITSLPWMALCNAFQNINGGRAQICCSGEMNDWQRGARTNILSHLWPWKMTVPS